MVALSSKWLIALFVGVVIAVTVVLMLPTDKPVETVVEPPKPGPGPVYAPSAHAVVDPQVWVIVKELSAVVGDWQVREGYEMSGDKLRIKKGGESSLYPYNLRFEPGAEDKRPLNCSFYERMEEEWRLAYCAGYTKEPASGSAAHRLMFHVAHTDKVEYLRLQVGNLLELYLERAK